MPGSPLAAAAAVVVVLMLPAAAMAQSGAGDNQYADPFGNSGSGGGTGQSTHHATHHSTPVHHRASSGPGPSDTAAPSAPAAAPVTTSTPAPVVNAAPQATTGAPAAAAATSSRTLPRTGFDAGGEAATGGILLLAGLTLRAQTRARRPARRRT